MTSPEQQHADYAAVAKENTHLKQRIEELEAMIKELRGDLNIANLRLEASLGEKDE